MKMTDQESFIRKNILDLVARVESGDESSLSFSTYNELSEQYIKTLDEDYDAELVSETLENLFTATEQAISPKIASLIDFVMQNEFQCFRIKCDHYARENATQAFKFLSNSIVAMRNLAENIPAQNVLDFLVVDQVKRKISIDVIVDFIQHHANDDEFGTHFVRFLKENTAEEKHGNKHSHRDGLILQRHDEDLCEIENDWSDSSDIPGPPLYPPSDSDEWEYHASPFQFLSLGENKPLHKVDSNTATNTSESMTPVTFPTTSNNAINLLDTQTAQNANSAISTVIDPTTQNRCCLFPSFFKEFKNSIPSFSNFRKVTPA